MIKHCLLPSILLAACASAQPSPANGTPVTPKSSTVMVKSTVPTPRPKPATTQKAPVSQLPYAQHKKFAAWQADFINRAIARGYDPKLVREVIGQARYKASAVKSNNSQPEFTKPIWSYVKTAASDARVSQGKAAMAATRAEFDRIEREYGVDRHVLTAIWGLETNYGKVLGNYSAISALASFAYDGRRMAFGEEQLFAILDMVSRSEVRVDQLKASWAGAMGMTQLIPTTFRDYAVDFNGDRNKDLWGTKGDALASAANYLSRSGWQSGEPVFAEIRLPEGFDYSLADGQKRFLREWVTLGVTPIQGGGFTPVADMLDARLYVPAGAKGPKLLTFKNFDVVKRYNNSNSYAMGINTLAMSFTGKRAISAPWPEDDAVLSRTQKKQLQSALTAQGFDTGGIDGLLGSKSQSAIRQWQQKHGLIADGYASKTLYLKVINSMKNPR